MIDFKALFGNRYRIFKDPSWAAETTEARAIFRKRGEEPWYYELRGPNVTISPKSNTHVVAWWTGEGNGALKRACSSFRRLDGEVLYFIPLPALQDALDKAKCYRKRQVTDAMRAHGRALAQSNLAKRHQDHA